MPHRPGHFACHSFVESLPNLQLHPSTTAEGDDHGSELSNTQWYYADRNLPKSLKNEPGAVAEIGDARTIRGSKRNLVDGDGGRDTKRPRHGIVDPVARKDARATRSTRRVSYHEGHAAESRAGWGWAIGPVSPSDAATTICVSHGSVMRASASTETIADSDGGLSNGSGDSDDDDDDDMLLVTPAVGSEATFIVRSSSSATLFDAADSEEGVDTAIFIDLPCQSPEDEATEPDAVELEVEEVIEDPVVSLPHDFPRAVKGSQGQKWFRAVMRNVFELLLIEDDFERATPDIAQIGSLIMFLFQICVDYGQPVEILEDAIETVASFARSRHFTVLAHLRSSTSPFDLLKSMSVIALLLASKDLPEDSSTERFLDALMACMSLEQEEFLFRRYILAPHQPTETRAKIVPRTAVRLRELLLAASSDLSASRVDLRSARFELTGHTISYADVELKGLVELADSFWLVGLLVDLWAVGSSPRMENGALAGALFACRSLMVGGRASESEVWPNILVVNTGFTYREAKRLTALYLSQARGCGLEIKLPVQDKEDFTEIIEAVEKVLQPVLQWV